MKYDIRPGVKGLIFDLDGTLADALSFSRMEKSKYEIRSGY
jgi:phosphoserine phosphatase